MARTGIDMDQGSPGACLPSTIHPMTAPALATLTRLRTACSQCNLRELCLPVGLNRDELQTLDNLVSTAAQGAAGRQLFYGGEPFSALYAVRFGFFKSTLTSGDGASR